MLFFLWFTSVAENQLKMCNMFFVFWRFVHVWSCGTMLLLFGEVVNGEMFPKAICRSLGGAFSGCPGWLGRRGWAKPAIFIYHPNGEKCC